MCATLTDIRKPLLFSASEKYSSLVLQFGVSIIIARLITPEQFGVFSVAYAIVGFAQIIREMGVTSYIIQKNDLTSDDVRASLFVTIIVAWILALLLLLCSPLIMEIYGPEVQASVYIILVNFLTMPLSSTIFAVLQREMRFDLLLRINLAGTVVNGGCAILLAATGWGAMSLAWGCVAGQLASAIVAGLCRPRLQHFWPSCTGARNVFVFGSVVMAGTLLQQVSTNVASLITARFVSLEDMGLLSRCQSVSGLFGRLIMDCIQPLMLPLFAEIRRSGNNAAPAFEATIGYISVLTWPFFAFLVVCADPVILVMFGEQWHRSAYLLQLVSIGGLFWIVQPVANSLLIALGHLKMIVRIQIVNQIVALIGVIAASLHGIEAVAMAAIPISAAHGFLWLYSAHRAIHLRLGGIAGAAWSSAFVTVCSVGLPIMVVVFGSGMTQFEKLILAMVGGAVGWLIGILLCRHPISKEARRLALHLRKTTLGRARI